MNKKVDVERNLSQIWTLTFHSQCSNILWVWWDILLYHEQKSDDQKELYWVACWSTLVTYHADTMWGLIMWKRSQGHQQTWLDYLMEWPEFMQQSMVSKGLQCTESLHDHGTLTYEATHMLLTCSISLRLLKPFLNNCFSMTRALAAYESAISFCTRNTSKRHQQWSNIHSHATGKVTLFIRQHIHLLTSWHAASFT